MARKLTIVLGCTIALATIVAVTAHNLQNRAQPKLAAQIGLSFLRDMHLDPDEFTGPIIKTASHAENIYSWRSTERSPTLQLDVSPEGDIICLYEVQSEKNLKQITCEEPIKPKRFSLDE